MIYSTEDIPSPFKGLFVTLNMEHIYMRLATWQNTKPRYIATNSVLIQHYEIVHIYL